MLAEEPRQKNDPTSVVHPSSEPRRKPVSQQKTPLSDGLYNSWGVQEPNGEI